MGREMRTLTLTIIPAALVVMIAVYALQTDAGAQAASVDEAPATTDDAAPPGENASPTEAPISVEDRLSDLEEKVEKLEKQKIGLVDIERAIKEDKAYADMRAQWSYEVETEQDALEDTFQAPFAKLERDITSNEPGSKEWRKAHKNLLALRVNYYDKVRELEADFQKSAEESAIKVYGRVKKVIEKVALEEGYGVVLNLHNSERKGEGAPDKEVVFSSVYSDPVVYYNDSDMGWDITERVIELLNADAAGPGDEGGNGSEEGGEKEE